MQADIYICYKFKEKANSKDSCLSAGNMFHSIKTRKIMIYKNQSSSLVRLSGIKVAVLSLCTAMFAMGCGDSGYTESDLERAKQEAEKEQEEAAEENRQLKAKFSVDEARRAVGAPADVTDEASALHVIETLRKLCGSRSANSLSKATFKSIFTRTEGGEVKLVEVLGFPKVGTAVGDFLMELTKVNDDSVARKRQVIVAVKGLELASEVCNAFAEDPTKYKANEVRQMIAHFLTYKKREKEYIFTSSTFTSGSGSIALKNDETEKTVSGEDTHISQAIDTLVAGIKKAIDQYETELGIEGNGREVKEDDDKESNR